VKHAQLERPERYLRPLLADIEIEVRTRVVGRRMNESSGQWEATPEGVHYSVIDSFVRVTAGTPPLLKGKA
jgi:hypothetical protein